MGIYDSRNEENNQDQRNADNAHNSQNEAFVQREATNEVQKAQLNILRFIAGTVFTFGLALIPLVISDHFLLKDVAAQVIILTAGAKDREERITKIEINTPTKQSRWSFGMQNDFTRQLEAQNSGLKVPNSRDIHDSHLGDL